ncbi:tumor necrosis factor receptor superfamily member 6-like [Trematomus bernacchii]|uniref:tumor necrosis factor receptor superfamily member 6-like n=1 Tax=Trematomus bernacchii TaxID=40690 RepID=UPI00146A3CB0|nr:tumor necrosis factor receptor superfamily member 6-like [Trematomus bernacchii]
MIYLRLSLAVISALSFWTIVHAAGCEERQRWVDGRCCDKCPPGTYMKNHCTEEQKTVCRPCKEGFYSDQYNMFDRCEECRSCLYEYAEKCQSTTNANCSCHNGFLCSNNVCSECQENKCVTGEKPKKTEIALDAKMIKYTYQCELLKEERRDGVDYIHVILGIGFVLVSLTLLVFLSYACMKNLKKYRAHNYPKEFLTVSINTSDSRLSKEESGSVLIMQDESKNNSIGSLCLEEVGLQFIQSVD